SMLSSHLLSRLTWRDYTPFPHRRVSDLNDEDLQFSPYYNTVKDAENYDNELRSYGTQSSYIVMDTDHGFGNHEDDWEKAVTSTVDRKSTRLNSSHVSRSYAVF